jgi:ABC-type polysaccharide/polyol phosphate transport system ATPase subunit
MAKTVIKFDHVEKSFFIQEERTFKDLIPSLVMGKNVMKLHNVLNDVSFEITQGETVGIVGKNGAGKSTILKLIAGVTYPNIGEVKVVGKVAPLIELGAGFHHELTGYENIFLNAAILGMHKKEIEARVQDIIDFSELAEFIHTPVKRYSSGMYMRLGFSVAIFTYAPILLIDEVLAVGDILFQKKCLDYLKGMKARKDRTIVFVSHDEDAVSDFCERAILVSGGKIIGDDKPKEIFKSYHETLGIDFQMN